MEAGKGGGTDQRQYIRREGSAASCFGRLAISPSRFPAGKGSRDGCEVRRFAFGLQIQEAIDAKRLTAKNEVSVRLATGQPTGNRLINLKTS